MRPVLPHLALVVVVPVLFLWGKDPHQGTVGAGTIPLIHHWLTQPRVLVTFWSLLLLPLEQNLDYDFRLSTTPLDPAFLGAVLVLVGILGVAVWARRRLPVFSFGILFFFVAIAPTNSLLPFVDFIAERHVYLPMAGFCLAFVALLSLLADRIPKLRRFIIGATLFYALCLGLLAVARNRVLANPLALWQQTAQASPNKGRPYLNLGVHLMQRGKLEQGLRALRRAEKLDPEHPRIQYNLGAYWERRGDLVRAELAFGRATIRATNPMYSRALARVLGRQGAAAYQASDLERAHAYFSRAAKVDGGYVKARFNLAVTLRALGRLIPAREALEEVLRQEPGHKKAQRILGELSR